MEYYNNTEHLIVDQPSILGGTLDIYGAAIIPNVISSEECEEGYTGMWNYFEHITSGWELPLKRDNEESYREFWKLYPKHSMLIQNWQAGHAQYVWNLRQNPKIVDIFAGIFHKEKEEMLVSFDGVSLHLPPEITRRGWYRGNNWHHTDQSFTRPNFECIQGFISLRDIEPGDATLSILEGSHKHHEEFADTFNITDKKDWFKLRKDEEHYNFYEDQGCVERRLTCKAGSLVLWDSRTIHCGVEPVKNRPSPNTRSIVYVCYMPRELSTERLLNKKRTAFENLRMTSHWPANPKLFAKNPQTYGKELPEINPIEPPVLSDLGKKLAGF